jgi:hypothetical protein
MEVFMAKLRNGILVVLLACGLGGTAFATGGVNVYGTWAKGDMGLAHNTAGTHYIGCWTNTDTVGPPLLYCEANDGAGNMNFCYTQNVNMVIIAQTIQSVSELQFGWDGSHGCTWFTVNNTSGPPGRKS